MKCFICKSGTELSELQIIFCHLTNIPFTYFWIAICCSCSNFTRSFRCAFDESFFHDPFYITFLHDFLFLYSRLPSTPIESPFRNLQIFRYALFCNRVLYATGILKLLVKKSFILSYSSSLIVCMYDPPSEAELKTTIAINKPNAKLIFPHILC